MSYDLPKRCSERYSKSGISGLAVNGLDYSLRGRIPNSILSRVIGSVCSNTVGREELRNHPSIRNYYEFATSEKVAINEPISTEETPDQLSNYISEYHLKKPFVCDIPDTILFGSKASVVDKNHRIVLETALSRKLLLKKMFEKNPTDLFFYHTSKFKQIGSYGTVVSLVDYYSGYHHWLFNSLTRLEGVKKYENNTGKKCKIIIPPEASDYILQSLALFGYTEDDILTWSNRSARANRVVIPSVRRIEQKSDRECINKGSRFSTDDLSRKIVSPSACKWVREYAVNQLDSHEDGNNQNKILISRSDVGRRTLGNKSTVYPMLKDRQFSVIGPQFSNSG